MNIRAISHLNIKRWSRQPRYYPVVESQRSSRSLEDPPGISESSPAAPQSGSHMAAQDAGGFATNIKGPCLTPWRPRRVQREALEVPGALPGLGPARPVHPVQGRRGVRGLCAGPASLEIGGILESERDTQPLLRGAQKPATPGLAAGLSWLSRLAPNVSCGVCAAGPRGLRCPGTAALAPAAAGEASPGSVRGGVPRRWASKFRFAIQSPALRPVLLFQCLLSAPRLPAAVSEPSHMPRMFLPAGLESGPHFALPSLCPRVQLADLDSGRE